MTLHAVRRKSAEEEQLIALIASARARVYYLKGGKNKKTVNFHMLRVAETRLQDLQNELIRLKSLEVYEVNQDLMINIDHRGYNGIRKG